MSNVESVEQAVSVGGAEQTREILIGHAMTWHDSALALCCGERLFAEAIERHTQCKRALQAGGVWYSSRALQAGLKDLGLWPLEDAAVTSLIPWSTQMRDAPLDASRPSRTPLASLVKSGAQLEPLSVHQLQWSLRGHAPRLFGPPADGAPGVLPNPLRSWHTGAVVHQLAHAANAVYTSPFEECVVAVIDGYGEGTAASFYHFADNRFRLLHETGETVSLGLLYASVTQLCGFDPYMGEEWKVMGLAAFGERDPAVYDFFRARIDVDGLDLRFKDAPDGEPTFGRRAWAELEPLVGGFRLPGDDDVLKSATLARSFQDAFADALIELFRNFGEHGLSRNLAYGGGCALNSALNGRIVPETAFERLHVPCAPGDDGNALGVVLYARHQARPRERRLAVQGPYLGSRVDVARLRRIIELGQLEAHEAEDEGRLCHEVAERLASGEILGWVQGRAEFGPRALGNRSILADPRDAGMKERINREVKFREFYRPLAPSILQEFGAAYFEDYQDSPYMERALRFRPEMRDVVPAVVHRDGTGRLQTVDAQLNPLFHRLIRTFHEKTGVPLLLNTSLNVMGKPIVHTVDDAVTVFLTTGLDALVVERLILTKPRRGAER